MNKIFVATLLILTGLLTGSCNDAVPPSAYSDPVQTPSPLPSPTALRTPDTFKYETKYSDLFGSYYLDSVNESDERTLVISEDNQPFPPPSNEPDDVTSPGFYLSRENRFDFEKVELVGKKVYFKTREIDGVTYEFRGTAGEEIIPEFSADVPVPFIKGILKEIKNGQVMKTENVKFGHRVIA